MKYVRQHISSGAGADARRTHRPATICYGEKLAGPFIHKPTRLIRRIDGLRERVISSQAGTEKTNMRSSTAIRFYPVANLAISPLFSIHSSGVQPERPGRPRRTQRRGAESGNYPASRERDAISLGAEQGQPDCPHPSCVTTIGGSAPFISTQTPFHDTKFCLVKVDPTSGPERPAARLWLSHPLTSAGAGKFSFMVSSFPEPERWCWTTTVPGTGFLGFTSSASGGAIDIRTDAAMTVDSSNCVKLRKPVASVHHSPVPCKIRTAQRQAVYWGKTWAGDFSMWALGVALRSGNFCDATQRRSVHIFETNVPVSSVTSFCDVRFFCTDDRNTASVSFCKFWQGVSGSSHDVPGRLFVQKHLLAGGPCERTISLRVLSADSRKDRCRRTLEPKFCNAYKFLV